MADIDVINTLFGNVKTRLKDLGGGYWAPEVAANLEAGGAMTVTQATGTNLHTVVDSGTVAVSGSVAVTGTFWQATQPVSGTVTANVGTTNGLALDATLTGGTQKTKLVDTGGVNVGSISAAGALKVDGSAVTQPVSGTFWQATQPVSIASSVTVAQATAANLNATVTGTVTSNIGTTNGLALDATLTGGTQKAINRGGAKGTTTAADVTSANVDVNTQALHVQLAGTQASVPVTGTFWQATQPVSGTVTANAGTGTFTVSGTVTANAGTGTMAVDTELPAAAALADTTANPTVPSAGALNMAYNGTTWDRVRLDAATGGLVVAGRGTAGAPAGGVISIQGVASGTAVPVSGSLSISGADTAADAHANPTTGNVSTAYNSVFNGTTWDRQRAGSPTADPGNTGVTAVQLHLTDGTNIQRVIVGTGDGTGSANKMPGVIYAFNGTTYDRLRTDGTTTGALLIGGRGTAGTPAGGVVSIQGVASGTAVPVSGTFWQATQPVSGTVTANAGTGTFTVSGTVTANAGTGTFTVDTELPAAAALADATANPTTTGAASYSMGYNGTTWDRLRSTTANGLAVDVTRVTGTVTISGTVTANAGTGTMTVDTELPAAAALADATANPTIPSIGSDNLIFNGTTWDRMRSASADALAATGLLAGGNVLYNGATWDRVRSATSAGGTTGTGLLGCGNLVFDGTNWQVMRTVGDNSDAQASAVNGDQKVVSRAFMYNGATWDRHYGNQAVSVLASGARTTTQTQADQTNYNWRGIQLVIDVTVPGTGSITPSIQGKDANGIYYTLLTGAAITTTTTTVLRIYPGIAGVVNVAASDILPRTFRVVITANNANSVTYSVAYSLIV